MKAEFINVGRNNICKTIEVKDMKALMRSVKECLLSKTIELSETAEPNVFCVWVGMQTVGKIKIKN